MGLEELFSTEVMRWRYTRALLCVSILQSCLLITVCNTYRILITEQVWNPFHILALLFNAVIKPKWIFSLFTPTCALIIMTRVHIKSYTVKSWIANNRWDYVKRLVSPRALLSIITLTSCCAFLLHHYASLADPHFSSLLTECKHRDGYCINHHAIIVLCAGLYLGLRFSLQYFGNNGNLVTCPSEQPTKHEAIKSLINFRFVRSTSVAHGVTLSMFFGLYLFYICLGGIFSKWMSDVLLISSEKVESGWLIWNVCFDLKLLFLLYLMSGLLATVLSLFLHVFNIFITEHLEMPISEGGENEEQETTSWRLCHTLLSNCELLQFLSFLDFYKMAAEITTTGRRSQVFLLSQPGGHPRNWQGVMNPALNLIRKFTERLRKHNCPEEYSGGKQEAAVTDVNKNVVVKSVKSTLLDKFDKIVSRVKRYPVFCYFLAELPDVTNRQIFSEAQTVIWAVQGLCELVARSYHNDKYGIVQRNIPDIIGAIVQLQQVLDKVSRVTVPRRSGASLSGGNDCVMLADVQLRRSLRMSLRSSLYTVNSTFGDSIREINVPTEIQNKLQSYLDYKEG